MNSGYKWVDILLWINAGAAFLFCIGLLVIGTFAHLQAKEEIKDMERKNKK